MIGTAFSIPDRIIADCQRDGISMGIYKKMHVTARRISSSDLWHSLIIGKMNSEMLLPNKWIMIQDKRVIVYRVKANGHKVIKNIGIFRDDFHIALPTRIKLIGRIIQ